MPFHPKLFSIQIFLKMFFREITSLDIINFSKELVKSRLRDITDTLFKQVFKISDKHLSAEEVKALNNLVKNKDFVIQ